MLIEEVYPMYKSKRLSKFIAMSVFLGSLTFAPQLDYLPHMSIAEAKVQMYEGKGEDYASEFESQAVAKQRALAKAIKAAQEQAGVYLTRYSKTVNAHLEADEITAITSNGYEVVGEPKYEQTTNQISGKTTVILWKATVNVNVDDSELQNWINRDAKNKTTIVQQTNEARRADAENDKKVEDLRKQAKNANVDKNALKKQFEQVDKEFLANQKLEEGVKLHYDNKYQAAIDKYNEALKLKPNFDMIYLNRGVAYAELAQYERAIEDYNKVIELNPKFFGVYYNLGITYYDLKDYNRAIQNYTKAIELNSKLDMAYMNRGNVYSDLGQYEHAMIDYNKAIKLNPKNDMAYNNRGSLYGQLKNYEQALADFNKAISLNPKFDMAYNNRGSTYAILGKYDLAIQDFNKALELNSKYFEAYAKRGLAHYYLKQYERAIQDWTKVIELNPKYAEAYSNRGNVYYLLGDKRKSIADYTKAIELNPQNALAYNNRSFAYLEIKQYEKAIADANKTLQLDSSYTKWDEDAFFAEDKEFYKEAVKYLTKYIQNNASDAGAYYLRGSCYQYQALNDKAKAEADFAKAKQLSN